MSDGWRSRAGAGAGFALLAAAALAPRLSLPGRIPLAQPLWSLRPVQFWDALLSGDLAGTLVAAHPGLTLLWICGGAQRLAGTSTTAEKEIVASLTVGLASAALILLATWLIRCLLRNQGHPESLTAAIAVGLLLALDPLLILLTGLVGPDGLLSLLMLAALLWMALHLDTGSKRSLIGAAVFAGLAVATKGPALLLVPLPLLLWPTAGGKAWRDRFMGGLKLAGFLALGVVLVTVLLLPAMWVEPLDVMGRLVLGQGSTESLVSAVAKGHKEYFLASTTKSPGLHFYLVQLIFRATPLVLCGMLLGCFSPSFRRNRLIWRTALLLLLYLVVMTLVAKKSFRYVMPAVVLIDVIGAVGLFELARDLAARLRRPAIRLVPWALIGVQGAWVLAGAPYYEYRLNPLAGGPRAAASAVELGWGAGMEQVHALLVSEADRLDRVIYWSGEYGRSGLSGPKLVSDRVQWMGRDPGGAGADCHVYWIRELQRQKKKRGADRAWLCRGVRSLTVTIGGLEVARVRCDPDRGFTEESDGLAAIEPLPAMDLTGSPPQAILLVTLASTRPDHLGAYECEPGISPTLDNLAREGVLFDTAISPMPSTDAAHISTFTGLFPRTHGCRRDGASPSDPALPNIARWVGRRGYRTAAFVSRGRLLPSRLGLPGFGHEDGPDGLVRDGAITIDRALAWLEEKEAGPWFLWVHLAEPDAPYDPPQPFDRRFSSSRRTHQKHSLMSLPIAAPDEEERKGKPRASSRGKRGRRAERMRALSGEAVSPIPSGDRGTQIDMYDGEISYMDSLLERLLKRVEAVCPSGDPPLIAVVGDHGEAMDELLDSHGFAFGHGDHLVQGIVRVPLLFNWRGRLPAGAVVSGPVQPVDLPATLAELIGAPGFDTQGTSLVPRIGDSGHDHGDLAFSELPEDNAREVREWAVQDGRYKLIVTRPDDRIQLFDLLEDPEESVNLAGSLPEVEGHLMEALLAWLEATPEPAPAPVLYSGS